MFNIVKLLGGKKDNTMRQIVFVVFLCLLLMQVLQLGPALMSKQQVKEESYEQTAIHENNVLVFDHFHAAGAGSDRHDHCSYGTERN